MALYNWWYFSFLIFNWLNLTLISGLNLHENKEALGSHAERYLFQS